MKTKLCTFSPICEPVKKPSTGISESANQDSEAVEVSLPVSMHTGQIIMVTKMLVSSDLRFYEFDEGVPVETWQSEQG